MWLGIRKSANNDLKKADDVGLTDDQRASRVAYHGEMVAAHKAQAAKHETALGDGSPSEKMDNARAMTQHLSAAQENQAAIDLYESRAIDNVATDRGRSSIYSSRYAWEQSADVVYGSDRYGGDCSPGYY